MSSLQADDVKQLDEPAEWGCKFGNVHATDQLQQVIDSF